MLSMMISGSRSLQRLTRLKCTLGRCWVLLRKGGESQGCCKALSRGLPTHWHPAVSLQGLQTSCPELSTHGLAWPSLSTSWAAMCRLDPSTTTEIMAHSMARGCLLATSPAPLDSPVYFLGGWDAWQSLACLRRPLWAYRGPRYLKKLESRFWCSGSFTMSEQHRLHLVVRCRFIFTIILVCFSRSIMRQCFSYLTSLTSLILYQ